MAALILLCLAILVNDQYGGIFSLPSFLMLMAAVGILIAPSAESALPPLRLRWAILVGLLAVQNALVYVAAPHLKLDVVLVVSCGLSATLVMALLAPSHLTRRLALGAAILVWLALQGLVISMGKPHIDDFYIVQGGASDLLHGLNPYLQYFQSTTRGVPRYHYTYGPMTLLLTAPFRLLGDVRYGSLVAVAATGLLAVWFSTRRGYGRLPPAWSAALLLAIPFSTYMIANMWTDVYPMLTLVGWAVLRDRHPRVAAVVLGIGIACKISILLPLGGMVLAIPSTRREVLGAGVVALALTTPFAIWTGPAQYFYDTVGLFASMHQPGWASLSLAGALRMSLGIVVPSFVSVAVLAGLGVWFCTGKRFRNAGLWTVGATFALLGLIVGPWANSNYFYMPIVLLAVAALGPGRCEGLLKPTRLIKPNAWKAEPQMTSAPAGANP